MVNHAFSVLQEATVSGHEQGKQNNTMALWALEQEAPTVAVDYAQYAASQGHDRALLTQAISLTESGRPGEAIVLFDSIKRNSQDLAPLAESLQRILAVDVRLLDELNDLEKYSFCRYRLSYRDSIRFRSVVERIADPNWKSRAILDRSRKLYDWQEYADAVEAFNLLNGIAITDKRLFNDIQIHELMLAAAFGNTSVIKNKLPTVQWTKIQLSDQLYLEALVAAVDGDSTQLKNNLMWIVKNNSFFVEGVLTAAQTFKSSADDPLRTYNILADALHLNPRSFKILKAYIKEARHLGFDGYADDAQQTLQQILPEPLFSRFIGSLQ